MKDRPATPQTTRQRVVRGGGLEFLTDDPFLARAVQRCAELERDLVRQKRINEIARSNLRDAHDAMLLIREAVELIGPVGAMRSGEHVCCAVAPTFHAEAMEIIDGIQAIWSTAERERETA